MWYGRTVYNKQFVSEKTRSHGDACGRNVFRQDSDDAIAIVRHGFAVRASRGFENSNPAVADLMNDHSPAFHGLWWKISETVEAECGLDGEADFGKGK